MSVSALKVTKIGNYEVGSQRNRPVKLLLIAVVTVLLSTLSGCTAIGKSEFSCPGLPEGVKCLSARDVYAATNDGNVPRGMLPESEDESVIVQVGQQEASKNGDEVIDNYVAPRLPDRPIPIRTPAQVMRIWVAPYEDTNGDLIVTGFIYTEIEPRKWVIGEGVEQSVPMLRPLQTFDSKTK